MSAFVEAPWQNDEHLAKCVQLRGLSAAAEAQAQDALVQLYDRHAPRLLVYLAARVHRDDVEDIHQAVWQRVWERLPDSFREGNFRGWLFQVARNYIIDWRRKMRPESLTVEQGTFHADHRSVDPAETALERERRDVLRRCLQRLAPPLLQVIQARLSGEEYASLSRRLGITAAQAQKMLHRAKVLLQACVNQSQ